ncbi:MAG: hypothetical protein HYR94_04710 [Chloroflexi bacterium]|nr:hypothetical protein [Chloroflexota bacterium]
MKLGSTGQIVTVTGFAPRTWSWANLTLSGVSATLPLTKTGLYTFSLWMREDGLHFDRLLLTTNTTYIPTGFGPAESTRLVNQTTLSTTITRTIVYTYDDLYRLTNANYSTGELFAYTYDPAGNRKSQTTLAGTNVYTYDNTNRLTRVDGQTYTWDNNGNLLNDGQRTFTYDSADRLTSVISGSVTSQFTYNGDGDRMAQIVAGVTTSYALDPSGLAQVLIESTGGQSKVYLPGLAQYDTAWSYYLPDRLGNLRQLANNTGQVNLAQSYDPFGNLLERTGSGQSIFGYTGEQTDPTGLVYLRARYYNPATGRFLTADSVVPDPLRSGGWNRYAYVGNNPINYIDPDGHSFRPFCVFGKDPKTGQCRTLLPPAFGTAFSTPAVNPAQAIIEAAFISIYLTYRIAIADTPTFRLPDFNLLPPGWLGQQPGFTLDETFNQCYPNIERPVIVPATTRNVSGGSMTSAEALEAGANWLGIGYREIAPGVYRSADGKRQFRITTSDLTDPRQGSHAHFESIGSDGRTIIENSHVQIVDP